jgi:hypothetical protein
MPQRTITGQQWNRILALRHQGLSDEYRWLSIWNILFDDAPYPASIYYTGTGFSDLLGDLIERFEQEPQGQNLLVQYLVEQFPMVEILVRRLVTHVLTGLRAFAAAREEQQQGQRLPPAAQHFESSTLDQAQLAPQFLHQPAWPQQFQQPVDTLGLAVAGNIDLDMPSSNPPDTLPGEPDPLPDQLLRELQEWVESQVFS